MNGGMSRSESSFATVLLQWTCGWWASSVWIDRSTTATLCPLQTLELNSYPPHLITNTHSDTDWCTVTSCDRITRLFIPRHAWHRDHGSCFTVTVKLWCTLSPSPPDCKLAPSHAMKWPTIKMEKSGTIWALQLGSGVKPTLLNDSADYVL